jgi:hypothetical protein
MSEYYMHEGTFNVPDGWRDQSMNVFRLPASKGKEAALIITRDYETSIVEPSEYAQAQQEAAKKNFPGFKSLGVTDRTVAGQPAAVVDYQWRANGSVLLRQRQAYIRHEQAMLTVTVSAQADDFDRVEDTWLQALDSLRLGARPPASLAANEEIAPRLPHVFALSTKSRGLVVYPCTEDACAKTDAFEVEDGQWLFFDSAGTPLRVHWALANKRALLARQPGQFAIELDEANAGGMLNTRLRGVTLLSGSHPLSDLAAIEEHLRLVTHGSIE